MAKLLAGIVGNTYVLVADAVESMADVFASLVVAAVVGLVLLGAAIGIAVQAVREILTPHLTPAPWTLAVLAAVMAVKWVLSRRMHAVGSATGSAAVSAEARHHLSDVVTSTAAFIGITIALTWSPTSPKDRRTSARAILEKADARSVVHPCMTS